jgi:hypothetical protein
MNEHIVGPACAPSRTSARQDLTSYLYSIYRVAYINNYNITHRRPGNKRPRKDTASEKTVGVSMGQSYAMVLTRKDTGYHMRCDSRRH